jgi:hypothetical protein
MAMEYMIVLSDDQIERFGRQDKDLWRAIERGEFDAVDRDRLLELMVRELVGPRRRWPLNLSRIVPLDTLHFKNRYPKTTQRFFIAFKNAAARFGLVVLF